MKSWKKTLEINSKFKRHSTDRDRHVSETLQDLFTGRKTTTKNDDDHYWWRGDKNEEIQTSVWVRESGLLYTQRFKIKTDMKILYTNVTSTSYSWIRSGRERIIEIFYCTIQREVKTLLIIIHGLIDQEKTHNKKRSLLQDGCYPSIKEFWNGSDRNPSLYM